MSDSLLPFTRHSSLVTRHSSNIFTGPSLRLRSASDSPNVLFSSFIFSSSFISAAPSRSISSSLRLPASMRRSACFSSNRRMSSMMESTSFAKPFSTISGSAAIRSGIIVSVKASSSRSRSASLAMIRSLTEDLQRPWPRQQERDLGKSFLERDPVVLHFLDVVARNERRELQRLVVAVQPPPVREQTLRLLAKRRIDRHRLRRSMERPEVLRAAREVLPLRRFGVRSGNDLHRHLHLSPVLLEQLAPAREMGRALRRHLVARRDHESIADRDERRAIEQRRAQAGNAQQQLAVSGRLFVGNRESGEKELTRGDRLRRRFDVVAQEMSPDDDPLHFLPVRMIASTLARTMLRPR